MDYLKYMDIFSIRFHLYTNNQPRFRNAFGGLMSSLFLIICIIIFILSSYDDIFKLNPITTKSEIIESEPKKININKEKIWIPFRMITYQKTFVDHREILYILPYYIEGKYNNMTGMNFNYHLLNYKLCNETSMSNKTKNYKIDIKLNQLFCIDRDDIPFGGSWADNYINYLQINIYLCKDGIDLNISDPRCSKIEYFLNNKNTSMIFEILYPVVQFQPTNYETPMAVIYRSYFYRLSPYGHKIERLYLQEHILSDDKSSIISKSKNTSFWGTSILYGDDYFLPNDNDSITINTSSRIYSLNIYMDSGYVFYTRAYKKIFLIISNVFPLFRIALFFVNKFTQHVKMSFVKRKLAGLVFENKERSKNALIKLRNSKKNINNSMNKIIIKKRDNYKYKKINNNCVDNKSLTEIDKINDFKNNIFERKNKNNICKNNSLNKSNISLNNDNAIKILNKKEILFINAKRKNYTLIEPLNKDNSPKENKINKHSKRKKYIFSYYYFFLDFLFDKLVNPQKFCFVSNTYFTVYNFMCQIYDISNYILLFKHFNLLNNIIKKMYEKQGICPYKPFKKININDNDIINKVNIELKSDKSVLFSEYL